MTSATLLSLLVDGFAPWDTDVVTVPPATDGGNVYQRQLARAATSGTGEAVVTGRGRLARHEVVVIACEFAFLAGTMGVAASERVVRAFDRAAELRLPVVSLPVSGGTRMQEGTAAFLGMVRAADAVARFRTAGGRHVTYLRHPTTGGVLASWASLAHVTFAEPGALIGLTGPRVVAALTGRPIAPGVQTAEHLRAHGIVDDVVPVADLRTRLSRVLAAVTPPLVPVAVPPGGGGAPQPSTPPALRETIGPAATGQSAGMVDAWAAVEASRRTDRAGLRTLLATVATDVTTLRGDGRGADEPGCTTALARVAGVPAVVVGHDREPGRRGPRLGPAGYRKARRAMMLAAELRLPLLTVVDTPGAAMTAAAEEGGLAAEIARCLATLTALPVPTVSVLLGEGGGAGAIALYPADRVVAARHAWLAPIAPEGASVIMHRTTARARELAAAQGIDAASLQRLGAVDDLVDDDVTVVGGAVEAALRTLLGLGEDARLHARRARNRWLGSPSLLSHEGLG